MEEAVALNISDQIKVLVYSFVCGTAALAFAAYIGFFRFKVEPARLENTLKFRQTIGAFLVFLLVQIIIVPAIYLSFFAIKSGGWAEIASYPLTDEARGWLNVGSMSGSFAVLLGYLSLQRYASRLLIWEREIKKGLFYNLRSAAVGAGCWFICYPAVLFIGQGIGLLIYWLYGIAEVDQVAVNALKMIADYHPLYLVTIFCMVILVPVMEELLFRGFLQTWLRGKLGLRFAILLTSMIFAFFHLSSTQGISNIQYFAALFLLSGFLGYLYEREGTLWAPIGLHSTFNAISVVVIHSSLLQSLS